MQTQLLRLLPALLVLAIVCEPALANRLESIGGGLSGSFRMKREFLQTALLVVGSVFLFTALMAVIVPRNNASFLNFANWKASSIVLVVLSAICFGTYFVV